MEKKYRGVYVDWWQIKRSTVYRVAAIILSAALLGGGGWWLWRNEFFLAKQEISDAPKDTAKIISFEGDVRIVRAATRETILITKITYVSAGDTIQTQADGRAQVQMIDGSTLSIRPNSTVVIRDSASIFGGTNVRVTLDTGQLNVKTQDQTEATNNVVEVLESENRVLAQTDASFNINEQTNGGEIRISRGGVESNVGGEKIVIRENEFAAVTGGKISPKERLMDAPKPVAPLSSEQITVTTDVSFRWQKPESNSAVNFHLQVSKSPFFVADAIIIEREKLTSQIFTLANLAPGTYYWRLRANAASGQTSDWGEPWKFAVVKQASTESLAASDWRVEQIGGNVYLVSGKTQAGATVRISGREVFASADGSFRLQISAAAPNVTVEISDERGNRSRYGLNLNSSKAVRQS
ncbi:MAG: FecR domain-containing protein [Pyrinomonadaceae bacterium]|nr:FecR domain-containing protein [Pyrinomonadaceae bacterium]